MGCWNATCQLSGLPIFAGEHVIGLVVGFNDELPPSGSTYVEDFNCHSFSYPIEGFYDDYGGIEIKEEQIALDLLYHTITSNLNTNSHSGYYWLSKSKKRSEEISLEYTNTSKLKSYINTESFMKNKFPEKKDFINEIIERDQLVYNNMQGIYRIGIILIKKDILDNMLLSKAYKKKVKEIDQFVEKVPLILQDEDLFNSRDNYEDSLRKVGYQFMKAKNLPSDIMKITRKNEENREALVISLLPALSLYLKLMNVMSDLRRTLLPLSGKGKQDYDVLDKYKALLQATEKSIIQKEKEYEY